MVLCFDFLSLYKLLFLKSVANVGEKYKEEEKKNSTCNEKAATATAHHDLTIESVTWRQLPTNMKLS